MRGVFVDCTAELSAIIRLRQLHVPPSVIINEGDPSVEDLIRLCSPAEVALVEHTVLPNQVFDACPGLRAVIFMGTGAATYIDLPEAARRGIRVLTTPGYGDRSVAEHAFALMLAAARNITIMDRDIRNCLWRPQSGLQLRGRKLAVLGLGGIGLEFANMARSFGMEVAGWNRSRRDIDGYVADIDRALEGAHVVSLHLGLHDETTGILDARRIRLPKPGYILVNTARAGLVDQDAMCAALRDGYIGHAALDVFPAEPLPAGSSYVDLPNSTLTAHAAYMTEDAYVELWKRTVEAVTALAQMVGDDPP